MVKAQDFYQSSVNQEIRDEKELKKMNQRTVFVPNFMQSTYASALFTVKHMWSFIDKIALLKHP